MEGAVKFSRCLYAQLVQQQYDAPRHIPMPDPHDPSFKAASLGLKLTAGFEILCSQLPDQEQRDLVSNGTTSTPLQMAPASGLRSQTPQAQPGGPDASSSPSIASDIVEKDSAGPASTRAAQLRPSHANAGMSLSATQPSAPLDQPFPFLPSAVATSRSDSPTGSSSRISEPIGNHPQLDPGTEQSNTQPGSSSRHKETSSKSASQPAAHSVEHDPGWQAFKARLHALGWFQGELEGSQKYRRREAEAAGMWRASEAHQQGMRTLAAPVRRIQELLAQPVNSAELRQVCSDAYHKIGRISMTPLSTQLPAPLHCTSSSLAQQRLPSALLRNACGCSMSAASPASSMLMLLSVHLSA